MKYTNGVENRLVVKFLSCICACLVITLTERGWGFSYGDQKGNNRACLACHGKAGEVPRGVYIDPSRFKRTAHANLGCPSCHGTVSSQHPDGPKVPHAECRECHDRIDEEYAAGLHAVKTACQGCHNPHLVQGSTDVSGQEINRICSNCHDTFEMTATHGEWLPQSELHLRMLPCITCHTGAKRYFISMYIVKSKGDSRFGKQEVAPYAELKEIAKGRPLVSLIDTNHDNYVSIEELRTFNRTQKSLRLYGMMTPSTVSHKFEILDSRRNCSFCHTSGAGLMQTSSIAVPEADGSFRRVPVEQGAVLDALYAAPDFYMMGSTKNAKLNNVGLAIICCGLIMPVGHGLIRFLTRNNRKGKEHRS